MNGEQQYFWVRADVICIYHSPVFDKHIEHLVGQPQVRLRDVPPGNLPHEVPADVLYAIHGGLDHLLGQPQQLLLGVRGHSRELLHDEVGQVDASERQAVPGHQREVSEVPDTRLGLAEAANQQSDADLFVGFGVFGSRSRQRFVRLLLRAVGHERVHESVAALVLGVHLVPRLEGGGGKEPERRQGLHHRLHGGGRLRHWHRGQG